MTRITLIEQILRQIYGGFPQEDSQITENLVNIYINQGIGLVVKENYKESIQLDGIGYVNNSFYLTFKGLVVSQDEQFIWKITLPQIPIGIGRNEGISVLQFKDSNNKVSLPCIPLSENQKTYYQSLTPIPNRILFYPEGEFVYVISTLLLNEYTASITMISGGDSTNLSSTLNIPDDYVPKIISYVTQMLMVERNQPQDLSNDGSDNKN